MLPNNKSHIPVLQFVKNIRTFSNDDEVVFNEKLKFFLTEKSLDAILKEDLTEFCYLTLDYAFFVNAFTDYGILSNRSFFSEVFTRIKHKFLPSNQPENELNQFIHFLFHKDYDYKWVQKINQTNWLLIAELIDNSQFNKHSQKLTHQVYNAIIILCHRLTTIGIDPYLVNKLPSFDDNDSPFFELNHQVSLFVKKHHDDETLLVDENELEIVKKSIDNAALLFTQLQEKKDELGTSLHLTFLLMRAKQHVERLRLLLNLFEIKNRNQKIHTLSQLITALIKAEQTKNSVTGFIKENTNALAYRIVSHSSEKGEHYIGFSKEENKKLFKSAMGGGLVVVFLVYIKHFIHTLHLSLFFEGLMFGLNYGLGFVLMHFLHLTLATKQPAMTAAYIAKSLEDSDNSNHKPWTVFQQIIRSQFVSLIGNLVIVLPVSFLSGWLLLNLFDTSIFTQEEATSQLYSNHSFYSASLIYAAIAGVYLSITGMVIGYVDNKVVYSEIKERIIKHPQLKKIYTITKREQIASFFEKNSGAIIGNLFLGFALGMAGNLGKFIGIPFDIRHVTISSGNFAISLSQGYQLPLSLIFTVFVGIILIGVVNIASSFLISFVIACFSRGFSWKKSLKTLVGVTK